jgi:hypothetical protein
MLLSTYNFVYSLLWRALQNWLSPFPTTNSINESSIVRIIAQDCYPMSKEGMFEKRIVVCREGVVNISDENWCLTVDIPYELMTHTSYRI